jgi:molecular chaperone DnaK
MVHDVQASLAAMTTDPDAGDKCRNRLLDLRAALDEVEDKLEWPGLVTDADKEIEQERNIINNASFKPTSEEKAQFTSLEREIRQAIKSCDPDLLRRKLLEMDRLGLIILDRQPGFWVARFEHLEGRKGTLTNPSLAETYIAQGRRAINSGDVEGLKSACRQLVGLLPANDPDKRGGGLI